jgi:hypothetical protein
MRTPLVFRVEDAIWGFLVRTWRRLRPATGDTKTP